MADSQEQKIRLMAYLDGEMETGEQQEFERLLLQSPDLQEQLEEFVKLKAIVGKVRFPEPKPELWDELPRRASEKATRGLGWILTIIGAIFIVIYLTYTLWWNENVPLALKLGLTVLATGFIVLLGSVVERRRLERKTDRYKEIVR